MFHKDLFWDLCFFNMYVNDLCDIIKYCIYLLFADDIKIYQAINSPEDCNILQSDTDSTRGWHAVNYMKLSIDETEVITFSRITNILIYEYKFFQSIMICTDSVKDLEVFRDSKLLFS
jgi:hypothetical protein